MVAQWVERLSGCRGVVSLWVGVGWGCGRWRVARMKSQAEQNIERRFIVCYVTVQLFEWTVSWESIGDSSTVLSGYFQTVFKTILRANTTKYAQRYAAASPFPKPHPPSTCTSYIVTLQAEYIHLFCERVINTCNKLLADTDFSSLSKFKRIVTSMDFSDYLHCF